MATAVLLSGRRGSDQLVHRRVSPVPGRTVQRGRQKVRIGRCLTGGRGWPSPARTVVRVWAERRARTSTGTGAAATAATATNEGTAESESNPRVRRPWIQPYGRASGSAARARCRSRCHGTTAARSTHSRAFLSIFRQQVGVSEGLDPGQAA